MVEILIRNKIDFQIVGYCLHSIFLILQNLLTVKDYVFNFLYSINFSVNNDTYTICRIVTENFILKNCLNDTFMYDIPKQLIHKQLIVYSLIHLFKKK